MFASALLVVIADVIIKKISVTGDFMDALLNPWMVAVYILYFIQVLLAIYIFINDGGLAVYGNLYIVFYSVLMILGGFLLFKEEMTMLQMLGVVMAILGGVLINGYRFGMQ